MEHEVEASIWGAVAGGIIAMSIEVWYPIIKRWRLTRSLRIELAQEQPPFLRITVRNGGYWTLHNATAYLTLGVGLDDILSPPSGLNAYIKPGFATELVDQCLCWSVRINGHNPSRIDIFAKECQAINLCYVGRQHDIVNEGMLALPSEEGWFGPNHEFKTLRAFLRTGRYVGRLRITSEDSDGRDFDVVIDPTNSRERLRCTPTSDKTLNQIVATAAILIQPSRWSWWQRRPKTA